jgi:prevent-host-death family protein
MSTTDFTHRSTPGSEQDDGDDGFAVIGRTIGIRALARNVSGVVDEVVTSGLPMILTKHGRPIAAIVPLDLEDTAP